MVVVDEEEEEEEEEDEKEDDDMPLRPIFCSKAKRESGKIESGQRVGLLSLLDFFE